MKRFLQTLAAVLARAWRYLFPPPPRRPYLALIELSVGEYRRASFGAVSDAHAWAVAATLGPRVLRLWRIPPEADGVTWADHQLQRALLSLPDKPAVVPRPQRSVVVGAHDTSWIVRRFHAELEALRRREGEATRGRKPVRVQW